MIIPIRCFTCNNVLASKYRRYLEIIKEEIDDGREIETISADSETRQSAAQKAFEDLKITRYCCRRHLLSHIDLVDKI